MSEMMDYVEIEWKPTRNSKEPVYKQIIDYISDKISRGDWTIGQKLPPQRKLAASLGVNRSTVETAIDELISYGLLESDGRRGTRIISNTWSLLIETPPNWNKFFKEGRSLTNFNTVQVLNEVNADEDYIQLGSGEMSPELHPQALINDILLNRDDEPLPLSYQQPLGDYKLRQAIADRVRANHIEATPANILITSGSLQSLHIIALAMIRPGTTVYSATPGYLNSLQVFQTNMADLVGIPGDDDGLMVKEIKGRKRVKSYDSPLLYVIPNYNNPTGTLMGEARRKEIIKFCQKERMPIIEDDAYGDIWFDGKPPRPLKAYDENGMVLYLGTVSKSISPGLRVGWIIGPESVIARLADLRMQIDYGTSSISQWIVYKLLTDSRYDDYLRNLRTELKNRRDFTLSVLEEKFSDIADWDIPQGGYSIWLRFDYDMDIDKLFKKTLDEKIVLFPGSIYDYKNDNALRITYAYASTDQMEYGLKKLREIIDKI